MKQLDICCLLFKLCLINVIVNCHAAVQKDQYQSLLAGQGLYNASDNVVILNATNFKTSIYGDDKGWLVEFYNSWCGFCFRFAPTWKSFASNVSPWRDVVVIAAIDCADDDNNPICREYEIMHYPLLKYFSVNANPSSLGVKVEKDDTVDGLRHNLITRLESEQQEGRGMSWPNITPYRNYETTNIWKAVPDSVKYFFLIFEHTDSRLGTEVILDTHKINSLQIRRVTSDNELLCETNKVTQFPSLLVLGRNESQKFLKLRVPTREGTSATIKEYLTSKGETIDEQSLSSNIEEPVDQKSSTSVSKQSRSTEATEGTEISDDSMYQLDLENALRYSISHEIPLNKMIDGEKMNALKLYFSTLAAHFPLRHSSVFLEIIRDVIKKRDSISGEEFSQLVKSVEEEMSPVYSGEPQWIGCKGSQKGYRGYPCGLWTMFHMLTVNFAMQDKDDLQDDPAIVLKTMHGYVKYFFGCADCSQHYVEMAARRKMYQVHGGDENILWLWKAHNEVNARLAADNTEDPKHTKIQYPASEHCSTCRYENGSWNEGQVLNYLKRKYSYAGINYDGSNSKQNENGSGKLKIRQERLALSKYTIGKKLGWDFTIFDISICVVLYVASATILILVCIKFAVKKTYKKKSYISLLGKV